MSLQIGVYTQQKGGLLIDLSARRARDTQFSTNEHGFSHLSSFVPMSLDESFYFYERPLLLYVLVYDNGTKVWEGRLEDVSIVDGGIHLTAFGYWRAMFDVPYTAVWSTTRYKEFFSLDDRQKPDTAHPDRYAFDTKNRLYITPRKNSTLGNTTNAKIGYLAFALPHRDERDILRVEFDYAFLAPSSWRALLQRNTAPHPVTGVWTFLSQVWNKNGTGSKITGSEDISISACNGLTFSLDFNATDAAYTPETGDNYLKITNLRIKTLDNDNVYADDIAEALLAFIDGVNSGMISTSSVLLQSPALDLEDEVYLDMFPGDILRELVLLGDNQATPRQWEVGVFEGRQLHLRPRGDAARAWYVDVSSLEVERTIETLINSVYAVYTDESGNKLRTSNGVDQDSIDRYGLTRRMFLPVETSDTTQAETHRDAMLEDGKNPPPRSSIIFDQLYDASGGLWPNYSARSGDTITIRNLPPSSSTIIDRIRTFTILETNYDVDADIIEVTPEALLPTLDALLSERVSADSA